MLTRDTRIDMISVCNADGSLQPLRFRYEDAECCRHRVNVQEILACKELRYRETEGYVFTCRASMDGEEHMVQLKYVIRAHCWYLFRVIY